MTMSTPLINIDPLAQEIAATLHEVDPAAQAQIARALEQHGLEYIQALVAEALEVERSGGLWSRDGSRKRSLGGVFFYLLRERTRPARREPEPPPQDDGPLSWEERLDSVQAALRQPGTILSAKVTVVGRPQAVKTQEEFLVLTFQSEDNLPSLPRGLPLPPMTASTLKVCVSESQWRRVKRSLDNPEDALVITGYAIPNLKQRTVVVFATWVTTRLHREQPAYRPESRKERPTWK